ncbi:ATP-dependent helicase [Microbacterium sp. LRZ72]|uniref:ATP-dependent helicase n=1 Tax=Microbacterium sp. LRZ72 TaxID=2942481 RepID=UPI0029AD0C3A|nr:ATP-dependent helicase [Microbacterium sp. LRZ72]MDX2375736.1 ATP-dependent helicase [Microbacterium sp. LRZ72]
MTAASGPERALAGLDERQREAATTLRGPVCVLAGAGSGKTRVITHRIAYGVDTGVFSPQRVMAVTFTTRAAGEMRGRLRDLGIDGVSARTFHAAALAQVNYFWPVVAGGESAPAVVSNKVRMLADAALRSRLSLDTATLRDVAAEIEWRKVAMLGIEEYARLGRPGVGRLSGDDVADLHTAYESLKDERRQMDFEDILLACAGMLETEPRVARAVHEQYRHFTVDEYQDVSPLQERLLQLWLGTRHDLCVVGDASQTIYSFTGADPRFLLEFARRHDDCVTVRLERNHRSSRRVLQAANALMRGRPGALELVPAGDGAAGDRADGDGATGDRAADDGAADEGIVHIPVTAHESDDEEAQALARTIRSRLARGASPDQFAVLYRVHAHSALLQSALAAEGIATTVLGGRRFFELPEVRETVMMLRGESVARPSAELVPSVRDVLRALGQSEAPPAAGGALRDAWEARSAILRLAEQAPAGATLRSFTDELAARAKDQHEPGLRTVTLSTIHASKGLEWEHVHVAGVSEGLLPISHARGLDQIDEERRLLYVALTRARSSVSLSWARYAGRSVREPSRFLGELGIRTTRAPGSPARSRTGHASRAGSASPRGATAS